MDTNLNIGDKGFKFTLVEEPKTGIPMFATEMDEFWIRRVADGLYSFLTSHSGQLVTSKLDDPSNFAGSMQFDMFRSQILFGETDRFRDIVFALRDVLTKSKNFPPEKMYVSVFSSMNEHYVNIMLDKDAVLIGAVI